ncbi:stress response protein SCP2 [Mycolicibacterium sp. BK556]|uniref:TerD family protein n=1 Tax=unclassified Mycolicibacterium TaxID=2636767 RepID=UPI00160B587E|nr:MULTISPECIES: TerD family protein [unclassified Mycolicibacterium]MBB3601246.1 stress response protein SCP2 [Mycolicibacterium sp. BK556]MBB3630998.1 stress response protein SCP2 [Mycolicibacterium sp. BK607]
MNAAPSLSKGANVALSAVLGDHQHLAIVIETTAAEAPVPADASILLLGTGGKVRSSDDLIFFNHPVGADGAVRLYPLIGDEAPDQLVCRDALDVDLAQLPDTVQQIVIAASIDTPTTTFSHAATVRMWVARADDPLTPAVAYEIGALDSERALIFGELYRRNGEWKVRAVGQGYRDGLQALVTDFGIEVEDQTADNNGTTEEIADTQQAEPGSLETADEVPAAKVAITRRRRAAKLASDWKQRSSPYLPVAEEGLWRRAALFPAAGNKTAADKELRATAVTLSVMEVVREFGRAVVALIGGPGGRVETFTEVRFTHGSRDLRPDGLIRVTRGTKVWHALVEVKTGASRLDAEQVEAYLTVAKAKQFNAVLTISTELLPTAEDSPTGIDVRKHKTVELRHLSWEEILAEAAILQCHNVIGDRTRTRVLEEFLHYACEMQSGMATFDDMGTHWVNTREAIKVQTLGAKDVEAKAICHKFDQLSRHIALQLTALTGQRVSALIPANRPDSVCRAKQLADSGELFGSLRINGAAGLVVLNANLRTERIGCSLTTPAPKSGRPASKIGWLTRQLSAAPAALRITAHHVGSRTESTSALLSAIRDDPSKLIPPNGRDIREFTVTSETPMGSKRAGSEGGFVTAMTTLTNTFYADVVQVLRSGKDG